MRRIAILAVVMVLLLPPVTPAATSGGLGGEPKSCQECSCQTTDYFKDECECVQPRTDLSWGIEGCHLISLSMDGKSVSTVCAPGNGCLYTFVQPN